MVFDVKCSGKPHSGSNRKYVFLSYTPGVITGACLGATNDSKGWCEIEGWCPAENDDVHV